MAELGNNAIRMLMEEKCCSGDTQENEYKGKDRMMGIRIGILKMAVARGD